MSAARFVVLGPYILDVLGRPVEAIPPGQGSALLEQLAVTVAGTGGGTAVDLARLGGRVVGVGAVGDDSAGRFLRQQLGERGIDDTAIATVPGQPTSATILPIRPNGERPALHLPGATSHLTATPELVAAISTARYLHIGGPDALGRFATDVLPDLLGQAVEHGAVTTLDLLSTAGPGTLRDLAPLLPHVAHLLINDDQAKGLTGRADAADAALELAASTGVEQVVVTCGAAGGLLVTGQDLWAFPALSVDVVDTTGCGDAFSAGYLYGLSLGWDLHRCCGLGTCCAAQVATVLGSDGVTGFDAAMELLGEWERLVEQA
ncbi:carbohydrate kinase family protein [Nocardioides mangrovicus]|uniref:carbohydrate kinase family protein n=1 Tax=Nocardioides mangrovicus TaxID=2478913 RepID=UPI00131495D8|nr:carbohydrate kinase family protein [Nocardioides mangrovicus]